MHGAINVGNIREAIEYYQSILPFEVKYEDIDWGLIQYKDNRIALLKEGQSNHKPHLGLEIDSKDLDQVLENTLFKGQSPKKHRDGSEGFYSRDKWGNMIEFIRL